MQYTENHSLPQWEASDPIQRSDFNGAMESIDAALGALNSAVGAKANQSDLAATNAALLELGGHTCHYFSTSEKISGDTLFTFDRAPKFVLLFGNYDSCALTQGVSRFIIDSYTYKADYMVKYTLSDRELIMNERTNTSAASEVTILAFY